MNTPMPRETEDYVVLDIDIPMKPKASRVKYPFYELECGQSFAIKEKKFSINAAKQLCFRWSKKLNRDFQCARLSDGYIYIKRCT